MYYCITRLDFFKLHIFINEARERQGSYNAWYQSCSSCIPMARGSIGGGCRLLLEVAASARVVVVGQLPGAVDIGRDCTKG